MQRSLVAFTLFVVACNKKEAGPTKDEPAPVAKVAADPKPAAPPPATPTPATPTPTAPSPAESRPASAACAPGAWKNTETGRPTFCISLPKGFALKDGKPETRSHHEWKYDFTGPGDDRPQLSITVQGISKPGVTEGMSAYGPNDDDKKVVTENVPNGKRIVTRDADYDKDEYAVEKEYVVLSKGEAVDVSKECGSCPPWEWIVRCWSSTGKKATAEDRDTCKSLRMP